MKEGEKGVRRGRRSGGVEPISNDTFLPRQERTSASRILFLHLPNQNLLHPQFVQQPRCSSASSYTACLRDARHAQNVRCDGRNATARSPVVVVSSGVILRNVPPLGAQMAMMPKSIASTLVLRRQTTSKSLSRRPTPRYLPVVSILLSSHHSRPYLPRQPPEHLIKHRPCRQ
jgi:hypothetical protein